jgi:hypothetical protein
MRRCGGGEEYKEVEEEEIKGKKLNGRVSFYTKACTIVSDDWVHTIYRDSYSINHVM